MSKKTKNPAVSTTQIREKGRNIFQPNLINWSYLYLGVEALTHKKINKIKMIFMMNQITPGTSFRGYTSIIGNQPPKNKVTVNALINIIFAYSPRKNKANDIEEYSTKYPATSSDSPSGRSKGALLVSASTDIKNITNIGRRGIANHTFFCALTISVKFKDPTHNKTVIIIKPIETSYETICAADLKAPKKAYLELLAQPAIIIP